MTSIRRFLTAALTSAFLVPQIEIAIAQSALSRGTVQHIVVHGTRLEGNLLGDSPDRAVSIYLPPSYNSQPARRYPVVYMLHGFTDSDGKWFGLEPKNGKPWINIPQIADTVFAADPDHEMIFVVPNASNTLQGSFYSSSVTTGDWEGFIAFELPAYIDSHYRTIARPESRGLAGHSMGGYGALRIGMKHPEVFSSLYALSACCLAVAPPPPAKTGADKTSHPAKPDGQIHAAEQVKTAEDLKKADFFALITLAFASAWSPDPNKPPFYLDLPSTNGNLHMDVVARWFANSPLTMLDQYALNLRRLHAIAFDVGAQDEYKSISPDLATLDQRLSTYNISHTYETYEGTHIDHIPQRLQERVLPFFAKNLAFSE